MTRFAGSLLEDGLLFRAMVGLLVIVALAASGYYRRRADRTSGAISADDGPFRLLRLVGLLFAAALLAYLFAPRWVAWAGLPVPASVRYGGAVAAALALPLFVWVFRTLGGNVTATSATRADHELVTTGPYRWVRHPLYSAAAAFWTGICLLAANWLLVALLSVGLLGVALRTPLEEQRLVEAFGDDYVAYRDRTGRYLPRLRRTR